MRIRIPDEIIELARQHPEKKLEIYGAAVIYVLDHELVYKGMADMLDPNARRKANMIGKQNRLGHTIIKSGTDYNYSVGQTKNKCVPHLNNSVGHTKISEVKTKKSEKTDEALTIYISNNIELYNIIHEYIFSNINTGNISYLINKQGEKKYIYSQMLEAEKVIKQVGLETFSTILAFIKQDDFWDKQILSIAKLNRKNKDGVPYYVVIMDKIRERKPKVISIPTL